MAVCGLSGGCAAMPRIARGGVQARAAHRRSGPSAFELAFPQHLAECSSLFSDMARKLGPALVT